MNWSLFHENSGSPKICENGPKLGQNSIFSIFLSCKSSIHQSMLILESYHIIKKLVPKFNHDISRRIPTFPKCREVSGKVGKCREMSGNVGKCREMSGSSPGGDLFKEIKNIYTLKLEIFKYQSSQIAKIFMCCVTEKENFYSINID